MERFYLRRTSSSSANDLTDTEALNRSQYYAKSKQLQDIAECKSLISLQAIVILNLFLLSTTRLSTCYTYLTTSMSIALRTDKIMLDQFNDLISRVSGFSAYQSLHWIFDKVIRQLYPSKASSGFKISDPTSQTVAFSAVRELESELVQWAKKLPLPLRLGVTISRSPVQRAHYMLYLTYAHTQLCLYRPFLHYVSSHALGPVCSVSSAFSCAIACIDAAQNIVALCLDMFKHGLLAGPNWIAIHILFSSMSCLLYSILMSRATYQAEMIFKDISKSRKILNFLAKTSFHARRAKITFMVR
ncbi:hypothetical protein M431DRAFT_101623 [Trichoderma harzianum CBS 226.95]|uniref:Transcription factor domain-containing protein n=1 Tax=Trichoderma harzianum CBS 226.95 TaxID=983964 RepID=A0A2T3ZSH4_TRIHA|nr:hypothetical protein M431DRAFT_101623 [Trichoderma harzianum CBS 226.95]PTB47739.1 hypothetical protein M431DRAFT_101623 [Trichoderma harzianum CBS 226.95]